MLNGFTLKFYHQKTKKEIFGKRLSNSEYRILDPETGEIKTMSRFKLMQEFESSPENKKIRTKRAS